MLDRNLKGIKLDPKRPKTSIVPYAYDVTILITDPNEVPLVQDALKRYQEASVATINIDKSTALAVGGWNKTTFIMGIAYHDTIKNIRHSISLANRQNSRHQFDPYNKEHTSKGE
jgi:hypothetical protein